MPCNISVPIPVGADPGAEALPLDKYIIDALYTEEMLHDSKNNIQMVTEDSEVSNDPKQQNEDKLLVTERILHQECKHVKSELDTSNFDKTNWNQKGIPESFFEQMRMNGECESSIMCPELSATHKEHQDYLELKMEDDGDCYEVLYERARFTNMLQVSPFKPELYSGAWFYIV
ncbi:hypothetical protein chiPu_0007871 [Chiloscyllium punctatum]|uniref:Uncharacterized protein n=1 Tax=Chiloscyllium punctatum TaxID=137246 RepID=A0A401SG93_CHIPU|nr:hypothetical protein [Chiloscyllium punctatum]